VDELYENKDEWASCAVKNIANMGYFSSDRTIGEYAEDIWDIKPIRL
jgi:starch phosphorylase